MGKNQDPGSGINIPDPQHWYRMCDTILTDLGYNNRHVFYLPYVIKSMLLFKPTMYNELTCLTYNTKCCPLPVPILTPGTGHRYRTLQVENKHCCGSGMFISYPGFWFLFIPDLGSRIHKTAPKEEKNFWGPSIFCSHKHHKIIKIVNYLFLNRYRKFCLANH
jgi:hypothetical protein